MADSSDRTSGLGSVSLALSYKMQATYVTSSTSFGSLQTNSSTSRTMYPTSSSVRTEGIRINAESPWTAGSRVLDAFRPTVSSPRIESFEGARTCEEGSDASGVCEADGTRELSKSVRRTMTDARFNASAGSWNMLTSFSTA